MKHDMMLGLLGRRVFTFVVAFFVFDLFQTHLPLHQAEGFAFRQKVVVPVSLFSKIIGKSTGRCPLLAAILYTNKHPLQLEDGDAPSVAEAEHQDYDQRQRQQQQQSQPFTETVCRSAIKTLLWRILSAAITLQTTMIFTGRFQDAINMLTVSFLPKFVALFVLDRFVNRGAHRVASKLQRSFIKVVAWRSFSIVPNVVLATLVLRDSTKASRIVSTDFVSKTVLLLVYERLWNQVGWGTIKESSSSSYNGSQVQQ